MTSGTRIHYHKTEWPAACAGQGWSPNDQARRRNVALDAMFLVKGPPVTTSHEDFGPAETTALFAYLRHLADPDNITLRLEWDKCCQDYHAYHTARQADYWQRRAYGGSIPRRLVRGRFNNKPTAGGDAAEDVENPKAARERLMTMRARARARDATPEPSPF